jgi:hypothetical protein
MVDTQLLQNAQASLKIRMEEIRVKLAAAGGRPDHLSREDRDAYSSCVEIERAMGRLRFAIAVGATADFQTATDELIGVLKRYGFEWLG